MLHKIKALCKEKHISLAELSRELGISKKAIFNWGKDGKHIPSAVTLYKTAKLLGTTVEELLDGTIDN